MQNKFHEVNQEVERLWTTLYPLEFFFAGYAAAKFPAIKTSEIFKLLESISTLAKSDTFPKKNINQIFLDLLSEDLQKVYQQVQDGLALIEKEPKMNGGVIANGIKEKEPSEEEIKERSHSQQEMQYAYNLSQQMEESEERERRKKQEEEEKLTMDFLKKMEEEERMSQFVEQQRSEQLAKEMLQQENSEQELRRKQLEEQERETYQCLICLDIIEEADIFPLYNCGHIFHPPCLKNYFESQLEQRSVFLQCPKPDCKADIAFYDMKQMLTKEQLNTYDELTLKVYAERNAKEVSWCPTPDCSYIFVYEEGNNEFNCPICTNRYCLACRVLYHEGMSCNEYKISSSHDKNDDAFIDFVKGQKYKQCPFCNFWVSKTEGCDHMRCRCGKEFCYKCGGIYQQCECVLGARAVPIMPLIPNAQQIINVFPNARPRPLPRHNPPRAHFAPARPAFPTSVVNMSMPRGPPNNIRPIQINSPNQLPHPRYSHGPSLSSSMSSNIRKPGSNSPDSR